MNKDNKSNVDDAAVAPPKAGNNFLVDFGPVLVFVVLYNYLRRSDPDGAIYTAAAVFAIVAILALGYSRVKHGKFSGTLIFTTIIIIITVGLAFLFNDPRFIYMKPTVINAVFGVVTIGGVFMGKNVLKLMMGEAFKLPEKAWNTLAVRWGLFFFAMAIINEVVWRATIDPNVPGSDAFWVNFKLFGFFPLTILFTFTQIPYILKHAEKDPGA